MANKPDPKQCKVDVRDGRLVVYMTPADLDNLSRIARSIGLTRSSLVACVMERLLIGGFSPIVGAKLCYQLQKRFEECGNQASSFYFGIRPLPPLPDSELTKRESTQLLSNIKKELKPC